MYGWLVPDWVVSDWLVPDCTVSDWIVFDWISFWEDDGGGVGSALVGEVWCVLGGWSMIPQRSSDVFIETAWRTTSQQHQK